MKLAGAYIFRGRLIVSVEHQTIDGIWRQQSAIGLDHPASFELVGEAVRRALGASRQGVPRPDHSILSSSTYPVLVISGATSNSTFMKTAKHVDVKAEGRSITITPHMNKGARGGFQSRDELARILIEPDDSALGSAVLETFGDVE